MKPITLDLKAPCPACNGSFAKCPQPTAAMRAAAAEKEDAKFVPIPPNYDTAPIETVLECGELWKCTGCGMPHRVLPATA